MMAEATQHPTCRQKIGKPEGELNLIAWAGYVEDGSTDPAVDWVTRFEKETGCQVNVKIGGTSDEMVQLMRTGQYDGVSASGDASSPPDRGRATSIPVNTDLVPNYEDIFAGFKDQEYNSVDGQMYGIPHGRGANLLMWNGRCQAGPDRLLGRSSSIRRRPPSTRARSPSTTTRSTSPTRPLYLKTHQPDLGIENPYELDEEQFDAAVDLLKEQKRNVGEYWSRRPKQISVVRQRRRSWSARPGSTSA